MTTKQNRHVARALVTLLWTTSVMLLGCSTSAVSPIGRAGFQLEDDEKRIWREARELEVRFDRSGLTDEDPITTAYINQVAAKISPPRFKEEIRLEVKILKHPTPNAFALPHGALYIHSGFLARMESEAQLAAVLAHEISHIIYRHSLQTFRNVQQAAAVTSTLGVIGAPAGLYGLGVILLGSVGALAAVSGYSQGLEEEADAEGLRLMVTAGYDPEEAARVMENVKRYLEQEEIKEPFFFSTHPRVEERIASYRQLLDREFKERAGWQGKDEFAAKMSRTVLDNALLELARGRFTWAQESIEKSLAREGDNSRAHFALAELFRQRGAESDRPRAEEEYKTAIRLDSKLAEAQRGLGLLYYKAGQRDLARDHFKEYLELTPGAKDRAYIEQYLREIGPGGVYP